jgi:hypothetical protein
MPELLTYIFQQITYIPSQPKARAVKFFDTFPSFQTPKLMPAQGICRVRMFLHSYAKGRLNGFTPSGTRR